MKKRNCILLLLAIFCLLSGCSPAYKSLEMEYDYNRRLREHIALPEGMPVPVHEIDNETPYQKLITKEIDIHEFAQKYCEAISTVYSDLRGISADIGIECLRETEEGALYSVHKVKQGGLLYIVYDNLTEMEDTSKYCYHNTVCSFYVQKKLSSKDFASIKEGSTITDIKKIDPTAQIWENLYNADPEDYKLFLGTYHYLSDGILGFWLENKDGELKVSNSVLLSDFKLDTSLGAEDPHPCKVLDQDLLR